MGACFVRRALRRRINVVLTDGGGAPTALQTFALTRVLVRPPVTPPYPLLCFYVTCAAAAAYELVVDVLRDGRGVPYGALALGALQLCVLGTLIWIAGTYPLRDMWPGQMSRGRSR